MCQQGNCVNCQVVGHVLTQQDKLRSFILLAYILDISGEDIDLDEAGLDMSQFETLDGLLHSFVDQMDVKAMQTELIRLVNDLAPRQPESTEKEN